MIPCACAYNCKADSCEVLAPGFAPVVGGLTLIGGNVFGGEPPMLTAFDGGGDGVIVVDCDAVAGNFFRT